MATRKRYFQLVALLATSLFFLATAHALDGGTLRLSTTNGWQAFEIISQGEDPDNDGETYAMPGTFDGTGALLLDNSTLRIQVNHEIADAAISELDIDLANLLLAIKNMVEGNNTGGASFVLAARQAYGRWSDDAGSSWTSTTDTSNTSFYRFCSGQSYEPDTFGTDRGFVDHLYITGEEGGTNRLFVLDSASGDFYQLSGVVGDASGTAQGGIGGMPYDAFENAALIDTGETQHVALMLSPDGGSANMQLYIGIKGLDVNGNASSDFLARNGLAYGSYFYFNDTLPTITPSTDGFFDDTAADALNSTKLEDVDTSPTNPTMVVLGDQNSGAFVFDINLDFGGASFNAGTSGFSITQIDAAGGEMNNHDNVDWTAATTLGGMSYPQGLIYVNEDNTSGEIWQMEPDGSNQTKVGQTTVGAESSGIFDLSEFIGYLPGSILITSNQGGAASLSVLINPDAEIVDTDSDGMPDSWETVYGFNPQSGADAITDLDGDGKDNLTEYNNGTDPSVFNRAIDDYSNDGISGWIWRGTSNGLEGVQRTWAPDWANSNNNWITPKRTYPPNWDASLEYDIETTGDFDGDGDADWLWRAEGNGDARWKVWVMESGTRIGQNNPPQFDGAHEWQVVGSGDTDRDFDDDVILNNGSSGEIVIWEMQGGLVVNTHAVGTKAGYDVVRVGDFDADGDVDLLLRQQGADVLRFWELDANAFVQEHTTQQTGAGFVTQCAGDFNGDGNDDVYLLAADGTSKLFVYVDFVRQAQVFGANQNAWTLYGCGDFDGDGTTDIQWGSADGLGYNRLSITGYGTLKTYYFNRYGGANPASPGHGFEYRGGGN